VDSLKSGLVENDVNAVFFDLDGTLTDINQREIEAIYGTVNHFGVRASRSRVKQACVQTPFYMDVFKKLGFELTQEAIHYWNSVFIKRYDLSKVRRGVKSTLKVLSKNYTLACVTSRETSDEVFQELRFLHIDGLFDYVVTRDVAAKHLGLTSLPLFPFHEQRRRLYECALALAKCSPNNTIAIGDMASELKPARELGITTIGLVTYKARKNELKEASDIVISKITQLQNVLLELGKSQLVH